MSCPHSVARIGPTVMYMQGSNGTIVPMIPTPGGMMPLMMPVDYGAVTTESDGGDAEAATRGEDGDVAVDGAAASDASSGDSAADTAGEHVAVSASPTSLSTPANGTADKDPVTTVRTASSIVASSGARPQSLRNVAVKTEDLQVPPSTCHGHYTLSFQKLSWEPGPHARTS